MTGPILHIHKNYENDPRVAHITIRDQSKLAQGNRQDYFLIALGALGTIRDSVIFTGIPRAQHFRWLDKDDDYKLKYQRAQDTFSEVLEAQLYKRAIVGVEEPIYAKGEIVGYKTKYSDNLLITALKANLPDKYAERTKSTATIETKATSININADVTGAPDVVASRVNDMINKYNSVRPAAALASGVDVVDVNET